MNFSDLDPSLLLSWLPGAVLACPPASGGGWQAATFIGSDPCSTASVSVAWDADGAWCYLWNGGTLRVSVRTSSVADLRKVLLALASAAVAAGHLPGVDVRAAWGLLAVGGAL